jgi:hypothetical protein
MDCRKPSTGYAMGATLNTLLFDDSDSTLPYIQTKGDRLGQCMVICKTLVTLFSKIEMDGCKVVYIREYEHEVSHQKAPLHTIFAPSFGSLGWLRLSSHFTQVFKHSYVGSHEKSQ